VRPDQYGLSGTHVNTGHTQAVLLLSVGEGGEFTAKNWGCCRAIDHSVLHLFASFTFALICTDHPVVG
jgi:hypothetical protein